MNKVKVPMDFGVENLQCPVHNNIELLVADEEIVRANSLILSYNSAVFYDIFFKQLQNSVDVTSFVKSSVDTFVKCLYSGKVNINHDSFRELCELADKFLVDWVIQQCDRFYMQEIDSISVSTKNLDEKFKILKFSFDEASRAPKRYRQKYKLKVQEKMSVMRTYEKRNFIQKYAATYLYLSVDQLNALLELAKGYDGILLKIVQENLIKQRHHLDENSAHILKAINLDNCMESDSDTVNQLFGNNFIVKTQQEFENLAKILELGANAKKRLLAHKPNLISKFVSMKCNTDVKLPHTLIADKSYASTVSVDPSPQRKLICDGNIVDDLHDPTNIPNLFSSLDSLNLTTLNKQDVRRRRYGHGTFYIEDILKAASTSPVFKNLYMVIELIATYGSVKRSAADIVRSDLECIIAKLVEVKRNRGWKRVNPNLFDNHKFSVNLNIELQSRTSDAFVEKYPDTSLIALIKQCDDLVSKKDSIILVCNRGQIQERASRKYSVIPDTIRMGEFLASEEQTSCKRIYKFYWKHPSITTCPNPGQCGFIINVTPLGELGSFDIGLCTQTDDYPEDIHFHPEVMTAQKMHFVLRRDYNRKSSGQRSGVVYVSWAGKPVYHSNHVHWGGAAIATLGYIALVVYYEVSESELVTSNKSGVQLGTGRRLPLYSEKSIIGRLQRKSASYKKELNYNIN